IKDIKKNPYQPRKNFNEQKLNELVLSIKEHGIVQPLLVRKEGEGYELVAGERRLRAAELAGLTCIPVVIKEFKENEMLEIALIENIQREDLNPLEEGEAYKRLMDEFGFTQEKLSERIGKSRSVIANTLRLLNLDSEVKKFLRDGKITAGHARCLAAVEEPEAQRKIAEEIIIKKLTVRDIENIINKRKMDKRVNIERKKNINEDPFVLDLEEKLRRFLGTKVTIKEGKNKGKIEIEYYNPMDLERISEKLFKP
ncbi:MAG: chromosome partitioning protein ParB, partial [Firmicutes bacterium HGW-Firmicutes-13]